MNQKQDIFILGAYEGYQAMQGNLCQGKGNWLMIRKIISNPVLLVASTSAVP
jgi:hypothetical protein